MRVNADFSQAVLLDTQRMPWRDSPIQGVQRRLLDRLGGEVARATSIVRYAPGSHFAAHAHPGGEEFLVLQGVFEDEHGRYPAGTYVRNPPGSSHRPGSAEGCCLFVKLWQFAATDRQFVRLDTRLLADQAAQGSFPLFVDGYERVSLECWQADSEISLDCPDGAELLVLEGSLTWQTQRLEKQAWLRVPRHSGLRVRATSEGVRFWLKTGHLRVVQAPPGA